MSLKYGIHLIVGKNHMVTVHYQGDTCNLELTNFGGVATLVDCSINKSIERGNYLITQYFESIKNGN